MPLHPQARAFLDQQASQNVPPLVTLSVGDARKLSAQLKEMSARPVSMAAVDNLTIPGPEGAIPVRVYRSDLTKMLPIILFFHGGGWVVGSMDSSDVPCRMLASASGCTVVSVEYRLAPEYRFPAGLEDCYAVACFLADQGAAMKLDPGRVTVLGDSSGGNLAAAVCLMARDRGGPSIAYQVLIYPVTDYAFDTSSYVDYADGYWLTRDEMQWFWNHYLAKETDGINSYASVLRAPRLDNLPPALIVTAEYDPLRCEGEAYARRLREAGVPVNLLRYEGMIHGFFGLPEIFDSGKKVILEMGGLLKTMFYAQK